MFPDINPVPIHAIPKSPKNAIEGWEEDAQGARWLRVRVQGAPEDGKANAALLKFLAKEWGVKASALSIVQGEKSRYKRVQIKE